MISFFLTVGNKQLYGISAFNLLIGRKQKNTSQIAKISANYVIAFIDNILNDNELKKMFSDVWIHDKSIIDLFKYISKINGKLPVHSLKQKLNFVVESKQYGLHKKEIYDTTQKVSLIVLTTYMFVKYCLINRILLFVS